MEKNPKGNEPLGAVAVRLGYASDQQVQKVLQEQKRLREREQNVLFGTLMQEMGVLTHEQLVSVLKHCKQFNTYDISEDALSLALRLRSTLGDGNKIAMFTGATSGEGVSTVTEQVARAMTMMGQGSVLLIDANYRSSSLTNLLLGQKNGNGNGNGNGHSVANGKLGMPPGLIEILDRQVDSRGAVHVTSMPKLWLMPTGDTSADYLARLMSPEFGLLLRELRKRIGMVLIDTPPILEFPDAALTAPHTDGVVLVMTTHVRRQAEVIEMKSILDGLKVPILGVVLNEKGKHGDARAKTTRKALANGAP